MDPRGPAVVVDDGSISLVSGGDGGGGGADINARGLSPDAEASRGAKDPEVPAVSTLSVVEVVVSAGFSSWSLMIHDSKEQLVLAKIENPVHLQSTS